MNCLVCGAQPTINSHLIPRVMAVEVQVGTSHALVSPAASGFRAKQSGLIDTDILCWPCDQSIGAFEGATARAFEAIRNAGAGARDGALVSAAQAPDITLRFYAALLWKYAVTRREFGQIALGPYKDELKKVAFEGAPIPDFFDVALMRLRLNPDDAGVFAYRAPKPDRKDGLNMYRVLVGGVLAFIKVDRRPWGNTPLRDIALGSATNTRALVMAAQGFEEFRTPQRLAHSDPRLSRFLDKQDAHAAKKA